MKTHFVLSDGHFVREEQSFNCLAPCTGTKLTLHMKKRSLLGPFMKNYEGIITVFSKSNK